MQPRFVRELIFKRFGEEHFAEYEQWFRYDAIRRTLYSIDKEWLDHILNLDTGIEYAVFMEEEMVAEVGISLPDSDHAQYVITNIAVHPAKSRLGLGSLVLDKLFELHPLKEEEIWVAFVEMDNLAAQDFFLKNGWKRDESQSKDEDMIRFYRTKQG